MHEKLIKIIELLKEVFPYSIGELQYRDGTGYCLEIEIGSKTGKGLLYVNEYDALILETRYSQVDLIDIENEPLRDIAYVAWGWYRSYKSRGYGMSDAWIPYWEKLGLITKETKTVTEYKID